MKSLLTLILCATFSLGYGQFRATKWGMTQQEVIKSEELVTYKSEDLFYNPLDLNVNSLVQTTTLDNSNLEITYLFENRRLTGGMYSFIPLNGRDDNSYLDLWEQTKLNLIKRYGDKYRMEGESLNWEIGDQKIKAFHVHSGIEDIQFIYVIYDSLKVKQQDIL